MIEFDIKFGNEEHRFSVSGTDSKEHVLLVANRQVARVASERGLSAEECAVLSPEWLVLDYSEIKYRIALAGKRHERNN